MKQEGLSIEQWELNHVESLTRDINTYYDRVENESDMSFLIKANAIRKSIISQPELIKNLDLATKTLEKEKEALK